MEPNGLLPGEPQADCPSSEELKAELLDIPETAETTKPIEQPGMDQILASALRYVRGKRGGDLLAVILVGSGARRALTPHSDVDLIALVKGQDEGQETIRISDRLIEIRYRGHKSVEQELQHVLRLPSLLRKGRILFELEAAGAKLVDKANQRFRQGPPPAGFNEKIRLKAECLHWLGKAEDVSQQPATAEYLLGFFGEDLMEGFFRLRGLWPTAPAETLRFISSRDPSVGSLLDRFLTAPALADRIALARELAEQVFRDVPNPPRID